METIEPNLIYKNELKYSREELDKISSDIKELNETFVVLNRLVENQNKKVIMLEDEIENSVILIDTGNSELEEAQNIDKSLIEKKGIVTGLGILAANIPIAAVLGFQVAAPIVAIGLIGIVVYVKIKTL